MWLKLDLKLGENIEEAQLIISLHTEHRMLMKNGQRTIMIWCVLTELLHLKVTKSVDISIFHETYDHWSVAVLTVTVHSSFSPTFDFFKNMLLSALDSIC